ncbi:MAG: RNA polymerase sigma factor [Ignavibacteria bacterium]|nr:RNA polymerase sigma factor [Ignavibacteria bacterium]MBK9402992.1 RNA polymerase sigma factor [Ignavibacteria bacterium]
MKTDESGLIEKLRLGDEKAFRILFDLYKINVYNTASGFLTNVNDAEDVTQEVFIQVFKSIKHFKENSKLSTWIYRITITKCLDLLRKKKTKKRFAFFVDLFENDEKDKEEVFVNYEHPGIQTDKLELSKILFKEIDKLPDNQRISFVLNKVEKLGYQEISEVMGISVPAVESLIFRAKSGLKKRLEKYYKS